MLKCVKMSKRYQIVKNECSDLMAYKAALYMSHPLLMLAHAPAYSRINTNTGVLVLCYQDTFLALKSA